MKDVRNVLKEVKLHLEYAVYDSERVLEKGLSEEYSNTATFLTLFPLLILTGETFRDELWIELGELSLGTLI